MKPILIETNSDSTTSIQIVTPEMNGIIQPSEVCILIENEQGDNMITLTPQQAKNLSNQLIVLINEIETVKV